MSRIRYEADRAAGRARGTRPAAAVRPSDEGNEGDGCGWSARSTSGDVPPDDLHR
jgi:hypothetical protein